LRIEQFGNDKAGLDFDELEIFDTTLRTHKKTA